MSTSRRGATGRVTISDIAERAGVSIGAVSFALNGRKGVSEETRARVLRVADELGWAPSTAARSLAEAKTETFGLVPRGADVAVLHRCAPFMCVGIACRPGRSPRPIGGTSGKSR